MRSGHPAILLAIALVALIGASPVVLVTAISLPEIPRMARMVRGSVLVLREQAYVEAAITCGGRLHAILLRHILPGAAGPILVQATYVFASAMILEAILSFLGAGTPPDVASWGNMMSDGRQFLQIAPWIPGFPALCLSLVVRGQPAWRRTSRHARSEPRRMGGTPLTALTNVENLTIALIAGGVHIRWSATSPSR